MEMSFARSCWLEITNTAAATLQYCFASMEANLVVGWIFVHVAFVVILLEQLNWQPLWDCGFNPER